MKNLSIHSCTLRVAIIFLLKPLLDPALVLLPTLHFVESTCNVLKIPPLALRLGTSQCPAQSFLGLFLLSSHGNDVIDNGDEENMAKVNR